LLSKIKSHQAENPLSCHNYLFGQAVGIRDNVRAAHSPSHPEKERD